MLSIGGTACVAAAGDDFAACGTAFLARNALVATYPTAIARAVAGGFYGSVRVGRETWADRVPESLATPGAHAALLAGRATAV